MEKTRFFIPFPSVQLLFFFIYFFKTKTTYRHFLENKENYFFHCHAFLEIKKKKFIRWNLTWESELFLRQLKKKNFTYLN